MYNLRRINGQLNGGHTMFARMFGTFLVIIAFTLSIPAVYAATDAEITTALEPLVQETVADLGLTADEARNYLLITHKAIEASKAVDALAAQRSEALRETAMGYALLAISIHQMKALLVKLEQGTPGTDIPADLVLEINKTSALASQAIVTSFSAASKRAIYMADWFVADSCKEPTPSCLDGFDKVLDVVSDSMDMMEGLTKRLDIFVTAVVKRMTY